MPTEERPDSEPEVVGHDADRPSPAADELTDREDPEGEGPDVEAHAGWGSAGG